MTGAVMNYDFGPKRHWRRWMWNRIEERVEDRRNALCVYLAGAQDFDRPLALARGFRDINMIAVERDATVIKTLRESGRLAIEGDLFDVVDRLSVTRHVNIIVADLCSGLSMRCMDALAIWTVSPFTHDCVFAFNILHGRDAQINKFREVNEREHKDLDPEMGNHRGMILMRYLLVTLAKAWANAENPSITGGSDYLDLINRNAQIINNYARPSFHQYRSVANTNFDTVVFRNPYWKLLPASAHLHPDEKKEYVKESKKLHMTTKKSAAARKSTTAVMAHRTMRMRAE